MTANDYITSNKGISAEELLDNLPDTLLVLDNTDTIINVHGNFETLFQKNITSLLGKNINQTCRDIRLADIIERVRKSQSDICVRDIKINGFTAHDDNLDIYCHMMNDGNILLTLSIRNLPGLTDKKSELQRATLTAKGLAAMLAHEIKNPLSGIKGAAQLVARKIEIGDRKLTDVIIKEVDRIRILLDELETFTNPGEHEQSSVNIHEALNHAVEVARAGFGASANIYPNFDPSLPEVAGHFDQLVQVFLNLIKNAVEAAGPECHLKITTAYSHGLWVTMDDGTKNRLAIEVSIQDNGPGIKESMKKHLFDPFVTNKDGGSGLGLAVVAQYIANMGGFIECENGKDQGAIFTGHLQAFSDYENTSNLHGSSKETNT